jgi:hypothetical protein
MFGYITGFLFTYILAWHLQPYNPEAATYATGFMTLAIVVDAITANKKRK